jgi:hypothetical protein
MASVTRTACSAPDAAAPLAVPPVSLAGRPRTAAAASRPARGRVPQLLRDQDPGLVVPAGGAAGLDQGLPPPGPAGRCGPSGPDSVPGRSTGAAARPSRPSPPPAQRFDEADLPAGGPELGAPVQTAFPLPAWHPAVGPSPPAPNGRGRYGRPPPGHAHPPARPTHADPAHRRPGTGAAATRPERGVPGRRRRGNGRGHPGARTGRSPSLPRRGRPPPGGVQEAFGPGASLARPASGPVHRAGAATGRRVGGPVPRRAAARPSARRGTRPGRAGSVPAAGAGSRHAPRRAGRRGVSSCRRSAGPAR